MLKIKLLRDSMSEKSDIYKSRMALFDNGDPEEFLLFVLNFKMTPEAPVTITSIAKMNYLGTL